MLKIENLSLSYDGKKTILEGLCLDAKEGSLHGLVGGNGSGKTSLFNCLYGTVVFQQGTILLNGSPLKRDAIAYLETENFFYPKITGKEYLNLFAHVNPGFDFRGWNELFVLPLNRLTDTYSSGMKKKLAFLGIMSFDRPVMILDEPFNGVDMETVQIMKVILDKLRHAGKIILITSHILESLTSICDSISYLSGKNIVFTYNRSDYDKIQEAVFGLDNAGTKARVARLLQS
ncbi:ABC-2 type transport system ATP-binding protein [Anseongella ginsenosidimutans]|uniref:ABC-2 type transport system ATP-binding protein n=1 Tax=Anseongella ginsenosidimutans TaxID=496056 RepID=A0A4V2UTK6_9SPHI|nr:ABC transporter ATP-binding protein [Anseongella ginsenosidimutans]QEC52623.1 ABC transporter ATP-binding protein [Anseongella ginsenosidimutans]TCS86546.1 ABC-2 type transport system ATP-binding protein [Anseongella ginsenosidimutans]